MVARRVQEYEELVVSHGVYICKFVYQRQARPARPIYALMSNPATWRFASLWNQLDRSTRSVDCNRIMRQRATSVLSLIRTTRLRDIVDTHQRLAVDLSQLQSTILLRLQRVESELMSAKLDRLFSQLHIAVQLSARQGGEAAEGIGKALRALVAPLPRGKAGGLARAKTAWRYIDGTFMPESVKQAAYKFEYERYASGGRARAASARRSPTGVFLPRVSSEIDNLIDRGKRG